MAKFEEIQDEELRGMMGDAYALMRRGRGTDAVHKLVETFRRTVEKNPGLMRARSAARRRPMMLVMRWPALGANLSLRALREGRLEFEFKRERFAVSEAMTYYEFALEVILGGERRRAERAAAAAAEAAPAEGGGVPEGSD